MAVSLLHNVLYKPAVIRGTIAGLQPIKPFEPWIILHVMRVEKGRANYRTMSGGNEREPSDGLPKGTLENVVPKVATTITRPAGRVNVVMATVRSANGPVQTPTRAVARIMVKERGHISRPTEVRLLSMEVPNRPRNGPTRDHLIHRCPHLRPTDVTNRQHA